jgi:1-acyl-sn-glycerol-3-phosphate acyltransferase
MSGGPSRYLLSAFNWVGFVSVSFLNLLVGFILQAIVLPVDRGRRISLWVNHWIWGRGFYGVQIFWSLRRSNYERVGRGPYIVVSNHGSLLDIPANMTLPIPLRVVGKTSLFKVPLMGWYMRFSRQIPLDASDPNSVAAMMVACRQALEDGISILIFPEGTRSLDGHLSAFNRGAFRLAKDLGVPLLPVVVGGTREILPKGSLFPIRTREPVTVQVLEPIDPALFSTARKLSNRVRERMADALRQLQSSQPA